MSDPQPFVFRIARADKVVVRVALKLFGRSARGLEKYGTTLERDDLALRDWLLHLQEELLDGANYIEAALARLEEPKGY